MPETRSQAEHIWDVLWEALEGGNYKIEELKEFAKEDSHFVTDLGIDSLDLRDFFLRLEETLNISISQEEVPRLSSVKSILDFVKNGT